MADKVTKEKVYATLGKYLTGELKEHTGHIDGFYRQTWDKDEKVWLAYPSGNHDCIGGTRTIVISRNTGEVLADAMVGE